MEGILADLCQMVRLEASRDKMAKMAKAENGQMSKWQKSNGKTGGIERQNDKMAKWQKLTIPWRSKHFILATNSAYIATHIS